MAPSKTKPSAVSPRSRARLITSLLWYPSLGMPGPSRPARKVWYPGRAASWKRATWSPFSPQHTARAVRSGRASTPTVCPCHWSSRAWAWASSFTHTTSWGVGQGRLDGLVPWTSSPIWAMSFWKSSFWNSSSSRAVLAGFRSVSSGVKSRGASRRMVHRS